MSAARSPGRPSGSPPSTVDGIDGVDGVGDFDGMDGVDGIDSIDGAIGVDGVKCEQESDSDLGDLTDSVPSPLSAVLSSESHSKRTSAKARGKGRKTRISSACLECKKRRRKCTGETPCQTCSEVQAECIYDPTMDRRSKAYFQRRLADGLAGVVQSDKSQDEILSMLREGGNIDSDVAAEVEKALRLRDDSATASTSSPPPFESMQDVTIDGALDGANTQADRVVCTAYCGITVSGSLEAAWYSNKIRQQQELKLRGPQHLITPFVIPDRSPLSMIFINFKNGVSNMLVQGMPMAQVLGPIDPEVDLIFRPRLPPDPFSASTWACELARIDDSVDVFTKLAHAFLLARYMRWHLSPTLENYLMLPEIMRPTLAQQTIPHFASAELYAIPAVRDCLVRGNVDLLERVGTRGTQSLKFYWPFDMDKAIDICPTTGVKSISRLFGICASDLSNWSCNPQFLINSPLRNGLLNTIDHQHSWDVAGARTSAN